jgi:hypothetical protein
MSLRWVLIFSKFSKEAVTSIKSTSFDFTGVSKDELGCRVMVNINPQLTPVAEAFWSSLI